MKDLGCVRECCGYNSNRMSLEYKSEVLTLELICSVTYCVCCCMLVTPLTCESIYHINYYLQRN